LQTQKQINQYTPLGLAVSRRFAQVSPAPILYLHRHQDGYIAFATERDDGDFRPLVAIRAGELEEWFPLFRDQLLKDAFVGINSDWRLRKYGDHSDSYGYPLHRSNRLRHINACYVDIDHYKLGLDVGTVIGRVINLQDSGQLPHASMIVKSGNGLWLLWLVCDPREPDQSPGAFPDKLDLYSRIQESIIERLLPLGADAAARDATRHIRLPGSLHGESENVVEWWVQGRADSGYIYTLQELALLLKATPSRRHGRETIAHNPRKRRGWVALNARRLRDFNTLRAMRGGFYDGCRNNAAKIYAWLLRCNATGGSDVYGLVSAMAAECHPRLPKGAVKDAVIYSKRMRRMFEQTISDWLNVTTSEAELLEGFPPARANKVPADAALLVPMPRQVQQQAIEKRRAAIREILTGLDTFPDVRKMSTLLSGRGIKASHVTLWRDLKALGVDWERTRVSIESRRMTTESAQLTLLSGQAPESTTLNPSLYCLQES
jgi:hypothetical protein